MRAPSRKTKRWLWRLIGVVCWITGGPLLMLGDSLQLIGIVLVSVCFAAFDNCGYHRGWLDAEKQGVVR